MIFYLYLYIVKIIKIVNNVDNSVDKLEKSITFRVRASIFTKPFEETPQYKKL